MGQRAKLSALDKGNVVEVGQRNGLYLQSPIVMPKAEFLAKTLVEIGSQWLTKVVPEKLIEMKAVIPAKYSGVFDAELAGEVVTWGADDLSLKMMPSRHAESSGYAFIRMSVADLYAKYDAWEKKPGRLPTDKDPLA